MRTSEPAVRVRRTEDADQSWLVDRLEASWGSVHAASRGRLIDASALPGFVAESGAERVGLATYDLDGDACELVTINAFVSRRGVGAVLLEAVADEARRQGCRRLWLVTTNDNTPALRFYQRNGMRLVALHVDALSVSRTLKPGISAVGLDGIPLRDELELERLLQP